MPNKDFYAAASKFTPAKMVAADYLQIYPKYYASYQTRYYCSNPKSYAVDEFEHMFINNFSFREYQIKVVTFKFFEKYHIN